MLISLIYKLAPKRLLPYLLLTIFIITAGSICNVAAPAILKILIDGLAIKSKHLQNIKLFVYYSALMIFSRIFVELKFVAYARWEKGIVENSFQHLFNTVQINSISFYQNNLPGAITGKIFQSLFSLKALLFDSIFSVLPLILEFFLILASVSVIFNGNMGLIIGLSTFVYITLLLTLNKSLLKYQINLRDSAIKSQGVLTQILSCWKDMKLTNGYHSTSKSFTKNINEMTRANIDFYFKRCVYGVIQSSPLLFMFIYSNYRAIEDYLLGINSVGSLLLINSYLLLLIRPLESFNLLFRNISHSYTDFSSANELLKSDHENTEQIKLLEEHLDHIQIENVSVGNILKDINMKIKKGEKIALVGASGSGKTTLLNLLTGLHIEYNGKILLNNTELKTLSVNQIRRKITYLSSDAKILSGSVLDNLLLGDEAEIEGIEGIEKILVLSCLHEKISTLDMKYQTEISEDKTTLSTGEKQRLKIARTLLLNGQIILFDESTSALDHETEEIIINNLLAEKDKTIIFTTHNQHHLHKFDRIFQIKNGALKELSSFKKNSTKGDLEWNYHAPTE